MTEELINIQNIVFDDLSKIPVSNTVKITKENYSKIDKIIIRKYSKLYYLPLVLSFNEIVDIVDIKIGTLLKLPDIDILLENIRTSTVFDTDNIPGITKTLNKKDEEFKKLTSDQKQNFTVAQPKLNISQEKVSYDKNTGIVSF